ncbi:hypothetical protein SDC9_60844 [bioreactor metagenome]|uniref:Uncharacterized protein n=1 Tax=bioreactor metagenome TaxID=1076179 RepID=A0A644XFE7_9ZZZZ
MKLNKFLSMACAVCLTLSSTIPGYAVKLPDSASGKLSNYAGSTVKCNIVVGDMSGGKDTTYVVDVAIPDGATKEQESQLIREAAFAVNGTTTRATRAVMDLISEEQGLTVVASKASSVGGGTLTDNYILLAIAFGNVSSINNASSLSVTVTSDSSSGRSHTMIQDIYPEGDDFLVYMYTGYSNVFFVNGDTIDVTAKPNTGAAAIGSCQVWASTQYMGG